MDLHKTIRDLCAEKQRLEQVIASLEALQTRNSGNPAAKRRGRKFMDPKDRLEVSARMRKYWAARRAGRAAGAAG